MGHSSNRRDCPAAGRVLTASECGTGRHRRYSCPADCPFDSFSPAAYDRLADLERTATDLAMRRFASEAPEDLALDSRLGRASREGNGTDQELALAAVLFRKRDPRGTTFLERWLAEGAKELKNDHRLILEGRAQSRIMLLEVLRVVDHQTLEAVDHLAPGAPRRRVVDRSLAAIAGRFQTLLTFGYPLPHYQRLLGGAVQMPGLDSLDGLELTRAIVAHLGGPSAPEDLEAWFWDHLVTFRRSLEATFVARQRRLLGSTDAHWVRADYLLQATPAEARACLEGVPGVEPDPPTREEAREGFSDGLVWFDDEGPPAGPPRLAQPVLGRILIGRSTWRLQGSGEKRMARLRGRFEERLGDRVRFQSQTINDLRPHIQLPPMPAGAEKLVVPVLVAEGGPMSMGSQRVRAIPGLSQAELLARVTEEANRAFLDSPVPLLQEKTPRQAAADPALRPTLVRMMKNRVAQLDDDNLRSGRTDSIEWMIRDLGLTEILQEPPPPRPRPAPHGRHSPAETDPFGQPGPDNEPPSMSPVPWEERPPAPPLPARPLSLEAAADRMASVPKELMEPVGAREELDASGSPFLEDLATLAGDQMRPEESALLAIIAVGIWFALIPPGCRAPEYGPGRWAELLSRTEARMADSEDETESGSGGLSVIEDCAQPELARLVTINYLDAAKGQGRSAKVSPEAQFESLAILISLIDLLDETLGRARE